MSCAACSAVVTDGVVSVDTARDGLNNALQCQCPSGSYMVPGDCSVNRGEPCADFSCSACASGLASTRDGSGCLGCDGTTAVLDAGSGDCACVDASHVLVETTASGEALGNKTCVACPARTRVSTSNPYVCEGCPDPRMTRTASGCVCDSGYDRAGVADLGPQYCVDQAAVGDLTTRASNLGSSAASLVTFRNIEEPGSLTAGSGSSTETSETLAHLWPWASSACFAGSNADAADRSRACNTLANLCALQLYDAGASACTLYLDLAAARQGSVQGWGGWPEALPFLYYASPAAVRDALELSEPFSFSKTDVPGTVDRHAFVLARYSLDGTFLGLDALRNELQYCSSAPQGSLDPPKWVHYGTAVDETSTCDLADLLALAGLGPAGRNLTSTTQLYELYYVDADDAPDGTDDDGTEAAAAATSFPAGEDGGQRLFPLRLFPVPVRVRNLRTAAGAEPNRNADGDETDDVLTRRFFLFEAATGRTGTSGDASADVAVVRYASSVTLTIPTRGADRTLIFPPELTVEYRERRSELFGAEAGYELAATRFRVQYRADIQEILSAAIALFSIAAAVAAGLTVLRIMDFQGRSLRSGDGQSFWSGAMVLRILVYFAGMFAHAAFWVLVAFTGYWLIFFKFQAQVFQLPVEDSVEFPAGMEEISLGILAATFATMTLRIAELLLWQTNVDVFMIDWERPKASLVRTGLDFEVQIRGGGAGAAGGAGAGAASAARGAGSGAAAPSPSAAPPSSVIKSPVSIWRTLFMANEFSELAVERRINVPFTLILLAVILEGGRMTYLATPQPDALDLSAGDLDPVLQFPNALFWFFVLVLGQYLVNLVRELYIDQDPARRLVDMCTVAKISVLVLDAPYHGWYLHCDAPYDFADGDMSHLSTQLQDEHGNVRAGRGMIGAPDKEAQVFEVYFPHRWRTEYNRLFQPLQEAEAERAAGRGAPASRAGGGGSGAGDRRGDRRRGMAPGPPLDARIETLRQETRDKVAAFLKGFIVADANAKSIRRSFRSRTYFQRCWSGAPEEDSLAAGRDAGVETGTAVFFFDWPTGWEKLLLRGVEWEILIWIYLLFALVYVYTESSLSAAVTATFADYLLHQVRDRFGQSNISKKTLIDERFLE